MALDYIPAIHRITHQVGLSIGRAKGLNVTQAEAHILAHLASEGDSTIADLHRAFAHKRSTLTGILDRLEERRLIEREVSKADRRSFVIRLTRRGAALGARVLTHLEALEERLVVQLPGQERQRLKALLASLDATLYSDLGE